MKKKAGMLALACCVLLGGCASILDREYSTVEAHSSKFWESEAAGTLRAESYQDIVNDLMLLIGQHTEQAVIRLYSYDDAMTVADALEKAAAEVQQETSLGSYAVEYITSSSSAQRGYYELSVQLGYRRTAEQIAAIVNATSVAALPSLLEAAVEEGKTELTVRVGYWQESDRAVVEEAVAKLAQPQEDQQGDVDGEALPAWTVSYYPTIGTVGLIECSLTPAETDGAAESSAGQVRRRIPEAQDGEQPPAEAPE